MLLTEQHLKFLSSTGGRTGSSESIHVKTLHCWKSSVAAQITPDRRQSKTLLTFDECGSKSIETVFTIAICRQSGDKWQSKALFLTILICVRRLYLRFRLPPIRCANACWTIFTGQSLFFQKRRGRTLA